MNALVKEYFAFFFVKYQGKWHQIATVTNAEFVSEVTRAGFLGGVPYDRMARYEFNCEFTRYWVHDLPDTDSWDVLRRLMTEFAPVPCVLVEGDRIWLFKGVFTKIDWIRNNIQRDQVQLKMELSQNAHLVSYDEFMSYRQQENIPEIPEFKQLTGR